MSTQLGKVVALILHEHFGPIIEIVGSHLYKHGISQLCNIKKYTELPLNKIKEAICILIRYGLVEFKPNRNPNVANYKLVTKNVLLMLRYPRYISLIKKKHGDEAEILLEELLQCGYLCASELILKSSIRFVKDHEKNVPLPTLRDRLQSLIIAKYLIRLPSPTSEKAVPEMLLKDEDMFSMPTLDIQQLTAKQNGSEITMNDSTIFWRLNHDRFHQDMRDKLIENAVLKKYDENAAELIRILLQQMYIRTEPWADVTNPVPIIEVKDLVKKMNKHPLLLAYFDQYVSVIEQDSCRIISKAGEASGGSFQIHMKNIIKQLTWELVEQIVQEKFDSKAARIFRLVKNKQYIEPEQIQKLAMIPAKEAKRLSYQLLEENFLTIQELKKPIANSGPSKSYTLFHIQFPQVARMVLELCYKTLFNILSRRNHERSLNQRIIDKKQRVDTIMVNMKSQGATEEQITDIDEMITPPEREVLERIETVMKKLNSVELEIDDTIFLLNLFIAYE